MSKKISRFHSQTLISTTIPISAGAGGSWQYSIDADLTAKLKYGIICYINVEQPPGVTDRNIRFYAMDDVNFEKWKNGLPNTALVVMPRVISGGIIFSPPSSGLYHIILDNTYSVITPKRVSIRITEIWVEEFEIPIIEKIAEKPIERPSEKPPEVKPAKKIGILQRLLFKIWHSRYIKWFVIFFLIQLFCAVTSITIAYLLHTALGLDFKDLIGYIAAAVGGSAAVLVGILYVLFREGKGPAVTPEKLPTIFG